MFNKNPIVTPKVTLGNIKKCKSLVQKFTHSTGKDTLKEIQTQIQQNETA